MKYFTFPVFIILLIKIFHCKGLIRFSRTHTDFEHPNTLIQNFKDINAEHVKLNSLAADIAWNCSIDPGNPILPNKASKFHKLQLAWKDNTCKRVANWYRRDLLNETQRRQSYLLCRGPKFDFYGVRKASDFYKELESIYSDARICLPISLINATLTDPEEIIQSFLSTLKILLPNNPDIVNFAAKVATEELHDDTALCLGDEGDMQKLMKFSRNVEVLKWVWLVWREKVGPPMKRPYDMLVALENEAAKRNGYTDIGAVWRDELEIFDLRSHCRSLFEDIKPLYTLLHGVARYFLKQQYGDIVPETGPIPAYLLGDLWSQNWESLIDFIVPHSVNIDASIGKANWTVTHMVRRAEDFYQSMGLPSMTDTFWRKSVFSLRQDDVTRCHGTAADMFRKDDFRLLYCSETSTDDFYVLHHEMGHIQYYMAYEHQPGIFRQANSALHESIGDTIWLGVSTPQHLHRLGLINDTILYQNLMNEEDESESEEFVNHYKDIHETEDAIAKENYEMDLNRETEFKMTVDEMLLLKQGLNKLPQIPFALLIDEYRWKYFEGSIDDDEKNAKFWQMALELQGIAPPGERGEEYVDVGAKFHVPDNTPYIRYFLSSFLQHQIFESLCRAAVFGRRDVTEPLPHTISVHKCDIYGSKAAGKILKDTMSRGHSQPISEILYETIGERNITSAALKRYYRPLYKLLTRLVRAHRIPIGW